MNKLMNDLDFMKSQPARYELVIHGLFDKVEEPEFFNLFSDYFEEYCEHTAYGSAEAIRDNFVLLYNLEHAVTTLFDYDSDLWLCYPSVTAFEKDRIKVIRTSQKYYAKRVLNQ